MTLNKHTHKKIILPALCLLSDLSVPHYLFKKLYFICCSSHICSGSNPHKCYLWHRCKKKLALVSFHVIFVYFLNQVKCRQTHSSGGKKGKMLMNILLNRFIFSCINFWFFIFCSFFYCHFYSSLSLYLTFLNVSFFSSDQQTQNIFYQGKNFINIFSFYIFIYFANKF